MQKLITPFIFLFILFGFTSVFAQQGAVEMDVMTYARDSGKTQVEIYYSIVEMALPFEHTGDTWVIPINARAELWEDGRVAATREIKKEKVIKGSQADYDATKNSLIIDGIVLFANLKANGVAALILFVKNEKGSIVSDTIKRKYTLPEISKDKFSLGGIELAGSLTPTTDRMNPFEKVGYLITPNPSKLFGVGNTKLNYYTELYVPASAVSTSADCEVITRVLDGSKHEMFTNTRRQSLKVAVVPMLGSIDVDGLPSDSYMLELDIKYNGNIQASMQKQFFFDDGMKLSDDQSGSGNAAALDEETIFSTSELATIPELELQEKGDQAMFIGTTAQQKDWKKLKKKVEADADHPPDKAKDIDEERKFLFGFWRVKDKEAATTQPLSVYKVFYKHVDEANKKYTYQKTPGWKTDFGRVYITYGAPEERYIKKELHNIDARPYITWEYYNNKIRLTSGSNPIFIFVDRQGGGNFNLVHSNVEGEVYEPDWYTQEAKRTN